MGNSSLAGLFELNRGARNIGVVDLGFLGDTLHLVPALWEIKRHHPAAELQVVTSPLGAEVLRLAPCVDRIWPVRLFRAERSFGEQWRLVRDLRRERFDLVLSFNGNDRCVILAGLTGARCRIAHASGRNHIWNRWLIPNWVPRQDPDLTVFEQRRRVLAACGYPLANVRFDLKIPADAVDWACALVPDGAIHLSTNSANPYKEWSIERHAALFLLLWKEHPGLRVVASGSARPRERERLTQLASALNDARFQLLPEQLSLAQLGAILKRCRLHLGPDSGVMHLAVALGIPTISFFRGQGAYRAWLPTGPLHQVILAPCHCVDHHAAPCEKLGYPECIERIEPAEVARRVSEGLRA